MTRTAPPLPPSEFATPEEASAHLDALLEDWDARDDSERHDASIVAVRARRAANVIADWDAYRRQYGDRPTQWSRSVVQYLVELEERVYATAPLPRPADRPHAPGSFEQSKWSRIAEWLRANEREREYLARKREG